MYTFQILYYYLYNTSFLSVFLDHNVLQFMFKYLEGISKVMIVDFDAHQGNGHERDFINDEKVYIMDMYNRWIYPNDREAKGICAGLVIRFTVMIMKK